MGQETGLYQLLYVSDVVADKAVDLAFILEDARETNAKLGVTGALWFDGTYFLQLIEGQKDSIHKVLNRITSATSHTNIDIIFFQPKLERLYKDWSMAYFGQESHNRAVAVEFAGGPDVCLRSVPSSTLLTMLRFLEEERQQQLSRQVG